MDHKGHKLGVSTGRMGHKDYILLLKKLVEAGKDPLAGHMVHKYFTLL